MMYMLGLISSCTGPFLQTYPKMSLSLYPPPPRTNFLIWKQVATGLSNLPNAGVRLVSHWDASNLRLFRD